MKETPTASLEPPMLLPSFPGFVGGSVVLRLIMVPLRRTTFNSG
jgi:hypothetical protein